MSNPPPIVKLRDPEPLQDHYNDGTGAYWSVARLIDDAKNLTPFSCPLAALDLTSEIWRDRNMLLLAFHCKKVFDADLSKPIIIAWDGGIADGRHRILKALVHGKRYIKAVRMTWRPEPCGKYDPEKK